MLSPEIAAAATVRCWSSITCRNCGAAYARAYTNDLLDPQYLWAEQGSAIRTFGGFIEEFEPLDLLLEEPSGW